MRCLIPWCAPLLLWFMACSEVEVTLADRMLALAVNYGGSGSRAFYLNVLLVGDGNEPCPVFAGTAELNGQALPTLSVGRLVNDPRESPPFDRFCEPPAWGLWDLANPVELAGATPGMTLVLRDRTASASLVSPVALDIAFALTGPQTARAGQQVTFTTNHPVENPYRTGPAYTTVALSAEGSTTEAKRYEATTVSPGMVQLDLPLTIDSGRYDWTLRTGVATQPTECTGVPSCSTIQIHLESSGTLEVAP